jgi:hypothetical protein
MNFRFETILLAVIILIFISVSYSSDDNKEQFLHEIPYDSMDATRYYQLYENHHTPKFVKPAPPGYFKYLPDTFTSNQAKTLKDFSLGYSITGQPYNQYVLENPLITPSKKIINLEHLEEPLYYTKPGENWLNYKQAQNYYIGYPYYYGSKIQK